MAGDDQPVPMIEREGLQAIMAEPDPYEQMRMYAEFVTGMGERISALWLALRGAAEVDDEARELYTRWDKQRLDGMRDGPVRDLLAKRAVRSDLTTDEAAAIFWVLTDPALYHQLVVEAGWARDRFRAWLYEAFQTQILAPPDRRHGGRRRDESRRRPALTSPASTAARASRWCRPSPGAGGSPAPPPARRATRPA